jgi:Arc/MetJ-type ribon-helix-helix transcriptional regulator
MSDSVSSIRYARTYLRERNDRQNTREDRMRQKTEEKESRKKSEEVINEIFILRVVTVTFRMLLFFS